MRGRPGKCDWCDKPAHSRGYCRGCYVKARRKGVIVVTQHRRMPKGAELVAAVPYGEVRLGDTFMPTTTDALQLATAIRACTWWYAYTIDGDALTLRRDFRSVFSPSEWADESCAVTEAQLRAGYNRLSANEGGQLVFADPLKRMFAEVTA